MSMTSSQLANEVAIIVQDKLGDNILVLDLREHSPIADFFVIVTASSTVHARAVAEELVDRLSRSGERPHHVEGTDGGQWILLDYIDVVVHIFLSEVRKFYGLERLWGDVPKQQLADDNR